MTYIPSELKDHSQLAEEAAEKLFNAKTGETADVFEPPDIESARAATKRLGELFNNLAGSIADALEAARYNAELLSSDRLQGIAEIVQNADDVEATQVKIVPRPSELLVSHNGKPVQLRHVLGLATPWLSTKSGDTDAFGRFGIGLMTLRSLSDVLEVHCHPYHVRLGSPTTVSPISPPETDDEFLEAGWTTFRIPLALGQLGLEELEEWLGRWDDSALLFLRHVKRVTLLNPGEGIVRELTLSRIDEGDISIGTPENDRTASRQRVTVDDGRSWTVYTQEVSVPEGMTRANKATGQTTPISVALPQGEVKHGQIHAGLPVTHTKLPVFANAQFDPLASREELADNGWNNALFSLVAELWSHAALDLFSRDPKAAWRAVPIAPGLEDATESAVVRKLEKAILSRARYWLSAHLTFDIPGHGQTALSRLAVETPALEGILTDRETADLADLSATLPPQVRDQHGRWRSVLEDWQAAGANLPEAVSVSDSLKLIADETRTIEDTIALVAVAIEEGLQPRLLTLPCVIANDGRRIIPPQKDSPEAVATTPSPLAEELGIITLLHPALRSDENGAPTVLKWLNDCGSLVDGSDDTVVVRRLASAGRSGRKIETPLADAQVESLREAFERMELEELRTLGPDIGRAVLLEAYQYDAGRRKRNPRTVYASASDAYLPKAIERGEAEGFSIAAEKTPGILWLSDHYGRILRSTARRGGIGAQRFLRLLGAETAPRLRQHPGNITRYANEVTGLPASLEASPLARREALQARRATYTLRDRDCPELAAVARDIARTRNKKQRRKRANALLATLGRAWERLFADNAEVESAQDSYGWKERRRFPAYWTWELRDVAWLDDESGTPRRPFELRIRTPGTVAIYGENSPDFLHQELSNESRRTVLTALGISGDPTRSELLGRLKELRDDSGDDDQLTETEVKSETAVVYKALAESLRTPGTPSNVSQAQLRREFEAFPGLLYTNMGWQPSQSVFRGTPILGRYKPFAPALEATEQLWNVLSLPSPSWRDCIEVIRSIALKNDGPDPDDEAILIEAFRLMAVQVPANISADERRKLSRLPLKTRRGWHRNRPVYATDDPILAEGLRNYLPLWEPGGDLQQFRPLLSVLRVQEIHASDAEVNRPHDAWEDTQSTDFFRSAVGQLQEDLARNEPDLAQNLKVEWDRLANVSVHILPSLSLGVNIEHKDGVETYQCGVTAKMDTGADVMFLRSKDDLARVDGGGRALATLFGGDPRRLAQVWRAVCDSVEDGREAKPLVLASERAEQEQKQNELDIEKRTESFRERIARQQRGATTSTPRPNGTVTPSGTVPNRNNGNSVTTPAPPRMLVNPHSLELLNPEGQMERGSNPPGRRTPQPKQLVNPTPKSRTPQNNVPPRGYTEKEKESVGFEIVKKLLNSDDSEILDIRTQRNVGADAMDDLKAFYELKVHGGPEPDVITLTESEVKRALSTPDFFLVVVSGIESADAQPAVRVLVDPLKQLNLAENTSITLTGVRTSKSLVYNFGSRDKAEGDHEPGESDSLED